MKDVYYLQTSNSSDHESRKKICRQTITESSYIRKATASINVLITAIIRNRNIMQPFKITHVHPTEIKRRTKFNPFKQVMWTRKVK